MRPRLFVYGTLKKGYSAHVYLDKCTLEYPQARISAKLYALGGFPGVVIDNKDHNTVLGELYSLPIDESELRETLAILDSYEGVPKLYSRQLKYAYTPDIAQPSWVYVYKGKIKEEWRVESGVW